MKKLLTHCLLGALWLATASCAKDQAAATPQACNPSAKTVKTVLNAAGIVSFNQALQHYVVSVPQPDTLDKVDLGIVCGNLPAALQLNGARVVVTGTFKEYGRVPPSPTPAGHTYYYLEVAQVASNYVPLK